MVVLSTLCVVRTHTDALTAVNAALTRDDRLTVAHTDRLRGTTLDAVGAANAFTLIQRYGMEKLPHLLRLLYSF